MSEEYEGIEPLPTGDIFSIEVGQPKKGFKYNVGQRFKAGSKNVEVVEILRDNNAYFLHGKIRYVIYVVEVGEKDVMCWKWYEDLPMSVTCYLD